MNTQTYFHTLTEAKRHIEPKQFRDSIQFAKKAAREFKEKEIQLINDMLEEQKTKGCTSKDTAFHGPGKVQSKKAKTSRTAIPQSILHQVHIRDRRQCQYPITGQGKCASPQWIEIHHKLPLSQGGDHSLDNLTTLCSQHHKWVHEEMESFNSVFRKEGFSL